MSSPFIHHRREKLLHAIVYFVDNTSHCRTTKLFKLLYFLDFEHYRQTGWSVTGLEYRAFPMGPIPPALYNEMRKETEGEETTSALGVRETVDDMGKTLRREFKPKEKFDATYFTQRELNIMKQIAFIFKEVKGDVMSAYSHDSKLPWKKIYGKGEGKGRLIPYALALQAAPIGAIEPAIEEEEILMLDDVFQGTGLR